MHCRARCPEKAVLPWGCCIMCVRARRLSGRRNESKVSKIFVAKFSLPRRNILQALRPTKRLWWTYVVCRDERVIDGSDNSALGLGLRRNVWGQRPPDNSTSSRQNGRLEAAVLRISRSNAVPPLAPVTNRPPGRAQREGTEDNAKDHEKKAS